MGLEQILLYLTVGSVTGFMLYFLLKKVFLGSFYAAIIVGIIGAIIGGKFLSYPIAFVTEFFKKNNIDFFAALIGSITLIWIYRTISLGLKKG